MGIFFKSESDLMEPEGRGWLSLLIWLLIVAAALVLAWRAPSLNNTLVRDNKNMAPLTGSLWIIVLPGAGVGEDGKKSLLKTADPTQPGAVATPGMMYLSRFPDGLIRPRFFFNNLPQVDSPDPTDTPPLLPFRYQVDDSTERRAMGVIQGQRVLMLLPVHGDFDDLGPELLAAAARGRKLRVALEYKPNWIFEAVYDVSEMGFALDQFKKDRRQL